MSTQKKASCHPGIHLAGSSLTIPADRDLNAIRVAAYERQPPAEERNEVVVVVDVDGNDPAPKPSTVGGDGPRPTDPD